MTPEMERCARQCRVAEKDCVQAMTFCLEKGGKYSRLEIIRALLDCAEMCQTCANALDRDSEIADRECGICAEACEKCAEALEKLGAEPPIQACAKACRRCSDECRKIAAAAINVV